MTHTSQSKSTSKYPACLYIVSTPIGNLEDITFRAIKTLSSVKYVACEDTRVTQKLLSHYQIQHKTLIRYNDFSQEGDRNKILDIILSGEAVAMVSDAGTPLISDPGYKLVKDALDKQVEVITIPGVSASIAALTVSGMPTNNFYFEGFLPPKTLARKNRLEMLQRIQTTLIFYESPKRLLATLKDIRETLGNKEITICREITKKFEETKHGKVEEIIENFDSFTLKGEIVLLINNHVEENLYTSEEDITHLLREALKTMPTKNAADFVATITSKNKKELYSLALSLKNENHDHQN